MTKIYEGLAALLIGVAVIVICSVRYEFNDRSLWTPSRMWMLVFGIICLVAAPVYFFVGFRSLREHQEKPRKE
jgi:hypothetical protein